MSVVTNAPLRKIKEKVASKAIKRGLANMSDKCVRLAGLCLKFASRDSSLA